MSFVRLLVLLASAGVAALFALGFSACIQLGPSTDDGNGDGGTPTVQDQCSEIYAAYCSRANECFGEDVNSCYPDAVKSCCGDACAKPATSEEKAIRACVVDLSKANCDDVLVAKLPDRCSHVITHD